MRLSPAVSRPSETLTCLRPASPHQCSAFIAVFADPCPGSLRAIAVDVVKTRLMTGGATGGIAGTFSAILKEEGAGTLMKGVVPRVMFLAPLAALTLSFYEAFAKQLVSKRLDVPVSALQ